MDLKLSRMILSRGFMFQTPARRVGTPVPSGKVHPGSPGGGEAGSGGRRDRPGAPEGGGDDPGGPLEVDPRPPSWGASSGTAGRRPSLEASAVNNPAGETAGQPSRWTSRTYRRGTRGRWRSRDRGTGGSSPTPLGGQPDAHRLGELCLSPEGRGLPERERGPGVRSARDPPGHEGSGPHRHGPTSRRGFVLELQEGLSMAFTTRLWGDWTLYDAPRGAPWETWPKWRKACHGKGSWS